MWIIILACRAQAPFGPGILLVREAPAARLGLLLLVERCQPVR
jgi:hypothetical protein